MNDIKRTWHSRCRMIWLLPHPPLLSVSSTGDKQEDRERETTCCMTKWGRGGGGAKSCDGKKAWSLQYSLVYSMEERRGGGLDLPLYTRTSLLEDKKERLAGAVS
jgi:hypothetical protein